MNGLRIGVTFVIVLAIFLLSVFQMQLRGYEKIGRVEEYTIYYNGEETCEPQTGPFYTDETYDYYYQCSNEGNLMVKNGFEEQTIEYVIENDIFTITDLEQVIEITKVFSD